MKRRILRLSRWLIAFGSLAVATASQAATFSVMNLDAPGTGLNDTSAFTPVGGNTATTLGQARLNVLNEAGRQWGLRVSSSQSIVIEVQFASQTCTSNSATLAAAGPKVFFTTSGQPNVLLPAALADAIAGQNLNNRNDISVTINSALGTGPGCLGGRDFYLGLDHQPGTNIDLLNVLLHELAHGLGFLSLTDSSGAPLVAGKFSAFDQLVYAETLGKFWPALTNAERQTAGLSVTGLVFNGSAVNAQLNPFTTATGLSSPGGHLRLYAPSTYSEGSSISHWDTAASPNLLMEPFITSNPNGWTDLTGCVLRDLGWPGARCADWGVTNTPPVALSQTYNINEDTVSSFMLQGSDADGTTALTYSIIALPAHGTLTLPANLTSATGLNALYAPASNYNGSDSFTFQVSDGTDVSASATIVFNVAAVNDAPQATAMTLSTPTNTGLDVVLSGTDVEGSALTYAVVTPPLHGTLTGTAPQLRYVPDNQFAGTDSFTFQVNDGQLSSAPATVSIQVIPAAAASAASDSSSGGGAWQLPWLLGLAALSVWRQRALNAAAAAPCVAD